jgi:hypothetical protein
MFRSNLMGWRARQVSRAGSAHPWTSLTCCDADVRFPTSPRFESLDSLRSPAHETERQAAFVGVRATFKGARGHVRSARERRRRARMSRLRAMKEPRATARLTATVAKFEAAKVSQRDDAGEDDVSASGHQDHTQPASLAPVHKRPQPREYREQEDRMHGHGVGRLQ